MSTIPEAAVEAAARAMYEHRPKHTDPARWETPWDEVPEGWKQGQRDAARVVLEAALTRHIQDNILIPEPVKVASNARGRHLTHWQIKSSMQAQKIRGLQEETARLREKLYWQGDQIAVQEMKIARLAEHLEKSREKKRSQREELARLNAQVRDMFTLEYAQKLRAEIAQLREKLVWQEAEIARLVIDRDQARAENAQVTADYTDPTPTIASVINQCGEAAEQNGWHERYRYLERSLAPTKFLEHLISKTALVGCEVSEAIEELRNGHAPDEVYESEGGKPEGYGVELADVVIRVFDLAWMLNLDLPGLIDLKIRANQQRGQMHGGKKI